MSLHFVVAFSVYEVFRALLFCPTAPPLLTAPLSPMSPSPHRLCSWPTCRQCPPHRRYPTLYWVPANNKQNPKKYEGAREVKDMLEFVHKNRSAKAAKSEL